MYKLDQIMTVTEASERYGINIQTLKNKLKPSLMGQEKIDSWIEQGLIRQSATIWLVTEKFIESNFAKYL